MTKRNLIILVGFMLLSAAQVYAYAPTNFHRPYDADFRLYEWGKGKHNNFRIGAFGEIGKATSSYNAESNKVGALQLYNNTESSLTMILGSPKGCCVEKIAQDLGISAATATDNGCRGRFKLCGDYEEQNLTLFTKYKLPIPLDGIFELGLFVPFREMKIVRKDNACLWNDLTGDKLSADLRFKDEVSSKLATFARTHGCLDINEKGWEESGLGDVVLMLGWQKDFVQMKQYLKNVRVNASVGVVIPTGEKRDEDQALALPLGLDGAWGIPASLGLDLHFVHHLRAGVDLSFLGIFDTTRTFRMKTFPYQTDFLLLNKGQATKSQGPMWKFTLFTQAKKLFAGLSAMVSYHFIKHDENRLSPKSYNFDYSVVNSAESLKEWATHSFVFQGTYTPWKTDSKTWIKPQLSCFYKLPVAGKRAYTAHTIGGQVAFTF